jgi:hypothetical protein
MHPERRTAELLPLRRFTQRPPTHDDWHLRSKHEFCTRRRREVLAPAVVRLVLTSFPRLLSTQDT